ncbi:MAG: TonB-dependent receptor plug domain-containing protein [Bacteroidia bacterium]|nr:TonB-dependent receptor plug domain-containing protein [Bacteroidia bacterium]
MVDFSPFGCKALLLLTFLGSMSVYSQNDSASLIFKAGLPEIKDILPDAGSEDKISIASSFESSIYEAPGIITVMTEEDIKASGYRDITDLLNQIPGFSMASDVQNGISFGVRGNWAEEAKLLVMVDGISINELSYGTCTFGQRLPLINIKRVEVIRGAGSSKYGGTAALGVINIITKAGQEVSGHRLSTNLGLSEGKFSRGNISYNYGGLLPNGVELTTMGSISRGHLSNVKLKLADSSRVNFGDSSQIDNSAIYLTLRYKGYKFKQFYENHNFQSTYEPIFSQIVSSISEFEKLFERKKIDINLSLNYKQQIPWNTLYGDPSIYDAQNLVANRTLIAGTFKTKLQKPYQLLLGLSAYSDFMRHQRLAYKLTNDKHSARYFGFSGFLEATYQTNIANFNLGTRLEQYAYFSPNLAPRLSVTKKFNVWHYKLIYNQAYKIPSLQNINLDSDQSMVPEIINEIQAQIGMNIKNFNLLATYFNSRIKNLIIYGYNKTTFAESYVNSGDLNNHGFDLEAYYKTKRLRISTTYSHYQLLSSTAPEIFCDTNNIKAGTLGLPAHKISSRFSYSFNSKITVNLAYVYESMKGSYVRVNAKAIPEIYEKLIFKPTHNVNLVCNIDNLYKNTVDLSIGVYNLLNTKLSYLYPFDAGYQPLYGMGTELMVHLKLKF